MSAATAHSADEPECARISARFKGPSNEHGWELAKADCRTQARAIYDLTLQVTQDEQTRKATLFQMGKATHGWWSTSGCDTACEWGIDALRRYRQLETDAIRRAKAQALEADLGKPSPATALVEAPPTTPPPASDHRPWWPWALAGGAGLALLGGSIPFFLEAGDLTSQAEDVSDCPDNDTAEKRAACQTRADDLTARSNDQKLIGGLFAGLGGLSLLAGAGLLVWWAGDPADTQAAVVPLPGGGAFVFDFSF